MSENAATVVDNAGIPREAAEAALADALAHLSKVEHERDEYKKLYLLLREENERLKRGLVGRRRRNCRRMTRSSRSRSSG